MAWLLRIRVHSVCDELYVLEQDFKLICLISVLYLCLSVAAQALEVLLLHVS